MIRWGMFAVSVGAVLVALAAAVPPASADDQRVSCEQLLTDEAQAGADWSEAATGDLLAWPSVWFTPGQFTGTFCTADSTRIAVIDLPTPEAAADGMLELRTSGFTMGDDGTLSGTSGAQHQTYLFDAETAFVVWSPNGAADASAPFGITVDHLRDVTAEARGTPSVTGVPGRIAPLSCDAIVGGARAAAMWAGGMTPLHPGGDSEFAAAGGTECTWVYWRSEGTSTFAYAPLAPSDVTAHVADLVAAGHTEQEHRLGPLLVLALPPDPEGFFDPPPIYTLVADGYRFQAGSVADLEAIHAAVMAAEALLEPPSDEPAPEVVAEPDTAEVSFDADTPSVLSALRTIADVRLDPVTLAATAATVAVLVALLLIPGRLVEHAVEAYGGGGIEQLRRRSAGSRLARWLGRVARPSAWWVVGAGILIVSALSTLIDPRAGLNEGTLRMFAGFVVTYLYESVLTLVFVISALRLRSTSARIVFRPLSIVVVIAALLFTRLTGFEPGLVFGVVCALALTAAAPEGTDSRSAWLASVFTGVVGIGSWLLYSGFTGLGWSEHGHGLFVTELLAGMTIGALGGLVLTLVPVPGALGWPLWRRSRWGWAGAYAVVLAVFLVIVLPMPESWQEIDMPLVAWVGLYLVACVGAVVFWGVARALSEPSPV